MIPLGSHFLFKLSSLRLASRKLGAGRGFHESKALFGVFSFTKSAETFKDLLTERMMFSGLTGSLVETSFLNEL